MKAKKGAVIGHGDESSIANSLTKISLYVRGYLEFFAVCHNCYLFILQFIAESVAMFRETQVNIFM